ELGLFALIRNSVGVAIRVAGGQIASIGDKVGVAIRLAIVRNAVAVAVGRTAAGNVAQVRLAVGVAVVVVGLAGVRRAVGVAVVAGAEFATVERAVVIAVERGVLGDLAEVRHAVRVAVGIAGLAEVVRAVAVAIHVTRKAENPEGGGPD